MKKTPSKILGETLEEIRREANLTQKAVGLHLGHIDGTTVGRVESGQRPIPFWEFVEFCRLAGKDPVDIAREVLEQIPGPFTPPPPRKARK